MSNAEIAKIVNDATAKAVNAKAGYDWTRKAAYTKDGAINVKMFGGDATKELNKVIQGVAPESDLSTVVANFIGIGQTNANCPKGSAKLIHSDGEYKGDEVWEHQNYLLKATTFKEGDFKVAQKKGDLYQIQLNSCTNPQKNDGSALANATNDFLTQDEANASIKNGLGGKDIVKIKSSTVDFTKIAFVAEIKDGTLKNLTISYTFSVDLQLNLLKITGSGKATTEMTYSNFVY